MIGIYVALVIAAVAVPFAVTGIVRGADRASRVVAAELLTVVVVAFVALGGLAVGSASVLDLVLVASVVVFLATVSFARALTGGAR